MANSSDIINAVGLSPGIIINITAAGTYTYTALTNLEVRATFQGSGSSGSTLTLNGIDIIGAAATTPASNGAFGPTFIAKGQTLTAVCTGSSIKGFFTAKAIP